MMTCVGKEEQHPWSGEKWGGKGFSILFLVFWTDSFGSTSLGGGEERGGGNETRVLVKIGGETNNSMHFFFFFYYADQLGPTAELKKRRKRELPKDKEPRGKT